MADPVTIRPAATVILVRNGATGLETLLLRRNSQVAFHGGAWVFPGGRVDPEDYAGTVVAAAPNDDRHEPAARVAAVREALEEAHVTISPETLVPFSHWTTPATRPKRYATWFYIAEAPTGEIAVDGWEITDHAWLSPDAALDAQRRGEIELPGPTFVSLLRLSASPDTQAALAEAQQSPYLRFEPRPVPTDDGFVSIYPGDVAYEDESLFTAAGPRHRLWMVKPGWRYEHSHDRTPG